jgi:hypothetical protein
LQPSCQDASFEPVGSIQGSPRSQRVARKGSVDSESSYFDSALSTASDSYISLSDSIKWSSPDEAFATPRRISCVDLTMARFSAPFDTSPALPRRLSEPVLSHDVHFDVPTFHQSFGTDPVMASGSTTPKASNVRDIFAVDAEFKGMVLQYGAFADDVSPSDSDLTRTDGEAEVASLKDRMASVVWDREKSPKNVMPHRPRRRGRRKDSKDPSAGTKPSCDNGALSPTTWGRSPREWRTECTTERAELRWSVNASTSNATDELLQTPSRGTRHCRRSTLETLTLPRRLSTGFEKITSQATAEAQESFFSPPSKGTSGYCDICTPSTARPTPSSPETISGNSLREMVASLDCPPPL